MPNRTLCSLAIFPSFLELKIRLFPSPSSFPSAFLFLSHFRFQTSLKSRFSFLISCTYEHTDTQQRTLQRGRWALSFWLHGSTWRPVALAALEQRFPPQHLSFHTGLRAEEHICLWNFQLCRQIILIVIPIILWQFGGLRPIKHKEIHSTLNLKGSSSAFGSRLCCFPRCPSGACVGPNPHPGMRGLLQGQPHERSLQFCPGAWSQLWTSPSKESERAAPRPAQPSPGKSLLSWDGRERASGSQGDPHAHPHTARRLHPCARPPLASLKLA